MADDKKPKPLPAIQGGDETINILRKHGLAVQGADTAAEIPGWLHTGSYVLNWAIGNRFFRGWPLSKIIEIFGDPATGKSFLILRAIAEAQKEEGVAFLDDTENALNPQYAEKKLGVSPRRLAYKDPRSETIAEHILAMQGFLHAFKAFSVKRPSIAALDSLGHLTTDHERDNPGTKDMTRTQEIYKLHRIVGGMIASLPICYIVANHKISSFGTFSVDDSGGGKGTKYAATVRVDLRSVARLKDSKGDFVGVRVTAYIAKNRIILPWRKVQFAIPFTRPIDETSGLVNLLLERNILQVAGNNLVYLGEDTGIKANKSDFLKQDQSGRELLEKYPTLLEDLDEQFAREEQEDPGNIEDADILEEEEV